MVLSAGAVNSPKLLQLSGLGPAALLQEHGVEVVANLPAVGGNLQDHLQIRSVYKVTAGGTLNEMAATWRGKAAIALEYALRRSGPMSAAPSQLGAFTRSEPGTEPRQHRVPRPAPEPRRLRRAAARLPGDHRQCLQPEPDEPRPGGHRQRPAGGRAADPAELSLDRRGPEGGGRQPAGDPADLRAAGARALRAGRVEAGGRVPERRRPGPAGRGHRARRSSIRSAPRRWGATATPERGARHPDADARRARRRRSPGCAWSTPARCR